MTSRIALMFAICTLLATGVRSAWAQAGEIVVELEHFGVGDVYRPGEFVGVALKVSPGIDSTVDEAQSAWIQWEVPNADGDIAEFGRRFTLQRGVTKTIWLYAPLSPRVQPGDVWPVRILTYEDGARGRELGSARIVAPGGVIDSAASLMATVGGRPLGVSQFRRQMGGSGSAPVYSSHEDTLWAALRPTGFPDRWEGLKQFSAIIWATTPPQNLNSAQVEALREWARRGGHLVISLPEDTNPWGLGEVGRTEFEDILPSVRPRVDADVPIADLLPVISKARRLDGVDFPLTLQVFRDYTTGFDAVDNRYEPLIALPDGRVIVVQRAFGHGKITLIGFDLGLGNFGSLPLSTGVLSGLPQADIFWNRILGRRADTPLAAEISALDQGQRLIGGLPTRIVVGSGALFRQQINMSGAAGKGLLLALLLFGVYWFIAGPVGFFLLRQYGRVHHAWLAFAVAAGVFTAFAWGGVQVLRQNDISIRHVTFLDHIARPDGQDDLSDPQLQRATAWLSVYLPGYGSTPISITSAEADGRLPAQRDILASWAPPGESMQTFPDVDRYSIDVMADPDTYELPTRSTSTQLYANWLGGVPADWGGLLRSDPVDPIRLEVDANGNESLRGTIINDLPGTLEHVKFIWIWNRRAPARRYALENQQEQPWVDRVRSGWTLNAGRMWAESEFVMGTKYQIPAIKPASGLLENINETYVVPLVGDRTFGAGPLSRDDIRKFMEILSLYDHLQPPGYMKHPAAQRPDRAEIVRHLGRELDLSKWFNRPALIIMGLLSGSECPIPLTVDGREVASEGVTMVRWVFPLPLEESIAFPQATAGSP